MATFDVQLPTELIKTLEELGVQTRYMLRDMVRAGGEVALNNMHSNIPPAFAGSDIIHCMMVTKSYRTKDGSINVKVGFTGYFTPKKPVGQKWIESRGTDKMAAELAANVFEHGRSSSKFPKHPFIRRSFNAAQIEAAMTKVQDSYLPKE